MLAVAHRGQHVAIDAVQFADILGQFANLLLVGGHAVGGLRQVVGQRGDVVIQALGGVHGVVGGLDLNLISRIHGGEVLGQTVHFGIEAGLLRHGGDILLINAGQGLH